MYGQERSIIFLCVATQDMSIVELTFLLFPGVDADSKRGSTSLGKHLRSSKDICGQESLTDLAEPGATRTPLARKRLKMEASLQEHLMATGPYSNSNDAALPTEHAQMDTPSTSVARKHKVDEVGQKQPIASEWGKSCDKKQPLSMTYRIARWVYS